MHKRRNWLSKNGKRKTCCRCEVEKLLTLFPPSRRHQASAWCNACVREDYKIRIESGDARLRASGILLAMRQRSRKTGLSIPEWTQKEVVKIIDGGRCCKTGIKFDLVRLAKNQKITNPFAPSPDRINNALGYTKKNTQWVVWIYNNMRKNFSQSDVDKFIKAIKNAS